MISASGEEQRENLGSDQGVYKALRWPKGFGYQVEVVAEVVLNVTTFG